MGKRPLTPAELAQRRAAARMAGRPAKVVSKREVMKRARERQALQRARGRVTSIQEEVAETLILGMRGALPGSTAQSMIDAAKTLAAKGGLHDVIATKIIGNGAPLSIRIGVEAKEYPPAIEDSDADDRSDQARSPLEN